MHAGSAFISPGSKLQGPAAHGGQMAKYFRLAKAPNVVIGPPSKPRIAITRLTSQSGLPEDSRYSRIATWPAGGVGIYDLGSDPRTRNRGPVDWVHYYVPRSTLDEFTDDVEIASIDGFRCQHGTVDQVLHQMTKMILLCLPAPEVSSVLFLDWNWKIVASHRRSR